jgi:hypothetical protein
VAKIYRFELHYLDTDVNVNGVSHVHYQTDVPIVGTEPSASTVLNLILNHYSSSGHNMSKWTAAMYNHAQLTRAVVREEVEPGSGDIPAVSDEALSLLGTLSLGTSARCPSGVAMWLNYKTDNAIRSGRGGTHPPGAQSALVLNSSGNWDTASTWYVNQGLLAASILDPLSNVFDSTGDINPGVYSRTRRARGLSPFFFKLTQVARQTEPKYVRRREPGEGS